MFSREKKWSWKSKSWIWGRGRCSFYLEPENVQENMEIVWIKRQGPLLAGHGLSLGNLGSLFKQRETNNLVSMSSQGSTMRALLLLNMLPDTRAISPCITQGSPEKQNQQDISVGRDLPWGICPSLRSWQSFSVLGIFALIIHPVELIWQGFLTDMGTQTQHWQWTPCVGYSSKLKQQDWSPSSFV